EDLKVGDKVKLNGREYIIEKKWDSGIKFDRDYGEYGGDRVTRQEYEKEKDRIGDQPEFLRSLQPHWEQMMMRSIIQWASDNGYHKVRFPTGETIKTIEGFDRLEQEIGKARKDMSDI